MQKTELFFLLNFVFYAMSLEAQTLEGISIKVCEDNTIIEAYGKDYETCNGLFVKTTTLPAIEYPSLIIELGKGDFFPAGKCTDLTIGNEAGGCSGENRIDHFVVCRPEVAGTRSPKKPICPGEEVVLSFSFNVPDGFSGQVGEYVRWSTGSRGESIAFITEKDTIIKATYKDTFGCEQEYEFPIKIEATNCEDCIEAIIDTCTNQAILGITKEGSPLWEDGSTESIRAIQLPGTFFVDIISPEGCHLLDTIDLEAFAFPMIQLGDSIITKEGQPAWVNIEKITPKGSTYWTFLPFFEDSLANLTIFEDFHIPTPSTSGYVIARQVNESGCENSDSTWVKVVKSPHRKKPCTRNIYPANAFSPNGYSYNDYWFLQSEDTGDIISLTVYDRWGGQLFERHSGVTNSSYDGWDGYSNKKKVPPGLYAFMVTIQFMDGEVCHLVGDVTVKK